MDPLMLGLLAGGGGAALAGLLGKGMDAGAMAKANEMNLRNQWLSNMWQQNLMYQGWGREDDAVQRRAFDLRRAGLSPVLAAGSAASASGPMTVRSQDVRPYQGNAAAARMMVDSVANVAQTMTGSLAAYHQARATSARADIEEARAVNAKLLAREEVQQSIQRTLQAKGNVSGTFWRNELLRKEGLLKDLDVKYGEQWKMRPGGRTWAEEIRRLMQLGTDPELLDDLKNQYRRDAREYEKKTTPESQKPQGGW